MTEQKGFEPMFVEEFPSEEVEITEDMQVIKAHGHAAFIERPKAGAEKVSQGGFYQSEFAGRIAIQERYLRKPASLELAASIYED